jgi:hypothetical protein
MQFIKNFEKLKLALEIAIKNDIKLDNKIDTSKAILDYKQNQKKYFFERLENSLKNVIESSFELNSIKLNDSVSKEKIMKIVELVEMFKTKDIIEIEKTVKKINSLLKFVKIPTEDDSFVKLPKNIPSDIKQDVVLDLKELEKCYLNECYRSCVILCGRVLEVALHRKYYEVTGNDILEKNPGIGLGNLIAKLKDKSVVIDPGLSNQIHLINQVRIFSVHKKKERFDLSKGQTQAMVLYTIDILERLFSLK